MGRGAGWEPVATMMWSALTSSGGLGARRDGRDDPQGGGVEERRRALQDLHLGVTQESLDSGAQPVDHLVASGQDGGVVHGDAGHDDAEVGRVGGVVADGGGLQHRLGGDAAPVEAHATQGGAFDQHHLHAQLGRAQRGDVPAGPGADDGQVTRVHAVHPTRRRAAATMSATWGMRGVLERLGVRHRHVGAAQAYRRGVQVVEGVLDDALDDLAADARPLGRLVGDDQPPGLPDRRRPPSPRS